MTLGSLKERYFGPATAYDQLTEVQFMIDGREYLGALAAEMELAAPGDRIYMLDWHFDPNFDIRGNMPGDVAYVEIGDLLVQRAAVGVDVRIVLNGAQYLGALGAPGYTTCYDAMMDLSTRRTEESITPPLRDRVLYDWSGAELTGSQHQKAFVIVRAGVTTAFVGGIDINPLMLDSAPHNSRSRSEAPSALWGWHDGGIRLRGGAAQQAYENFSDRWQEASTLSKSRLWVKGKKGATPRLVSYTPPPYNPVPPWPASATSQPTPSTSVQVLRSRYRTKLNRPGNRKKWITRGGSELLEVHETLQKAIKGATRYIYIEDQFLADHPELPGPIHSPIWAAVDSIIDHGRLREYSLLPDLSDALQRGVNVILVGSGSADPGDLLPGQKNQTLNPELCRMAEKNSENLAVWRLEDVTVHTKLLVIDDRFAAIGSANMQSRSMLGVDSELQVAVVDQGSTVEQFRTRLWSEHLGLEYDALSTVLRNHIEDLGTALGMWRAGWGPGGGMWFTDNNPLGFSVATLDPGGAPRTRVVRAYVGPGSVSS